MATFKPQASNCQSDAHERPATSAIGPGANTPAPALALAWLLWLRNRAGLSLVAGYLAAMAAVAHAPGLGLPAATVYMLSIPCGFGILYLMGVFAHSDADAASVETGYPSYMLILPLRTSTLVLWPMVYGTAAVSLAWIVLAEFVIRPRGATVPVDWPAAMLATITSCVQAIFWTASPFRYFRLLLVVTVVPGLIMLSVILLQRGVAGAAVSGIFLAILPLAYLAALRGLSRARHNESIVLNSRKGNRPDRPVSRPSNEQTAPHHSITSSDHHPPEFRDAAHAQIWYEWRRNGWTLPVVVGAACVAATLPLFWLHDLAPLASGGGIGSAPSVEINAYVKSYLLHLLMAPVMIAAVIGSGNRPPRNKRADGEISSFLATRPVGDFGMILAKWRASALSCIATWFILTGFAVGWLLTPAKDGTEHSFLLLVLVKHAGPQAIIATILLSLMLVAWTLRSQVVGLFAAVSERRWVILGYPAMVYGLLMSGVVIGMNWIAVPGGAPSLDRLFGYFWWFSAIMLLLKTTAAAAACGTLLRARVVTARQLAFLLMAWACAVIALWCALHVFAILEPAIVSPIPQVFRTDGALCVLSVLSVPIARVAAAPICLARARRG